MAVVPGRYLRGCLDVSSFLLCMLVMVVQLALIDYYYISVMKDNIWFAWVGGDAFVCIIFLWLFVLAVKNNQQTMEETCSLDGKVKYAWIAWFFYSLLLVGKIATCFRMFHEQLPQTPMDNNDKLFDNHMLTLGLGLSVFVYIFLLDAHHYTPLASARQLVISYLMLTTLLDLLDSIAFLDLLWQTYIYKWKMATWLHITLLVIACTNFVLPTFTLLKLRFNRNQRIIMVSDKVWAFLYTLLVNGPFLGFRIYLFVLLKIESRGNRYDASIFVIKNIVMIYLAFREVWTRLQYWRQKRGAMGSRGELTAQGATDHEDN